MNASADFKITFNEYDALTGDIQHIPTGFYNITNQATHADVDDYTIQTNAGGFVVMDYTISNSGPVQYEWFQDKTTQTMIESLRTATNSDNLFFEISGDDIPTQFHGTYIHKYLYNWYMIWKSPNYAFAAMQVLQKAQSGVFDYTFEYPTSNIQKQIHQSRD
jgi:hypothetical protein